MTVSDRYFENVDQNLTTDALDHVTSKNLQIPSHLELKDIQSAWLPVASVRVNCHLFVSITN